MMNTPAQAQIMAIVKRLLPEAIRAYCEQQSDAAEELREDHADIACKFLRAHPGSTPEEGLAFAVRYLRGTVRPTPAATEELTEAELSAALKHQRQTGEKDFDVALKYIRERRTA